MNWGNFKDNQCPNCKDPLEHGSEVKCSNGLCGFRCSILKFNKIVNDLYQQKGKTSLRVTISEEENQRALNDL
jgi:hypothetical protein